MDIRQPLPQPEDKILALSKLKAFADDKLNNIKILNLDP